MRVPEIRIDGVVGSDLFEAGITARDVASQLAVHRNAPEILVTISSYGGQVFEGLAIFDELSRFGGKVTTRVSSIAASIASVILMAGDSIEMAPDSLIMIHEAHSLTVGPADEHAKSADVLRKLDGTLADIYSRRSGRSASYFRDMMRRESWLDADEAIAAGLVDRVSAGTDVAAAASWTAPALPSQSREKRQEAASRDMAAQLLRIAARASEVHELREIGRIRKRVEQGEEKKFQRWRQMVQWAEDEEDMVKARLMALDLV